jgi:hypothetical protein
MSLTGLELGVIRGNFGATQPTETRRNASAVSKAQTRYVPAPAKLTELARSFIGTARFTLKGDILQVSVKMHGADPGQCQLFVFTGNCDFLGSFGKFKVDSSGDGEKSASINVAGQGRSFFADAIGSGIGSNDSLIVNL